MIVLLVTLFITDNAYSIEGLKEVPANDILDKIEKGEVVEYDNVTIKGDLDISVLNLPRELVKSDLSDVIVQKIDPPHRRFITSPIKITNSKIHGNVNFRNAIFSKPISFINIDFEGYTNFTGTQFNSATTFMRSKFQGTANFPLTQFDKTASFIETQFNNTHFEYAYFNRYAYFNKAKFNEGANFNEIQFRDKADFRGGCFNKTTNFKGVQFRNSSDFGEVQFVDVANFRNVDFEGNANFSDSRFSDAALFENAIFHNTLSLTGSQYVQLYLRWGNIKKGLVYDDLAYLLLIENYKKLGLFEDADNCYYQYRREHRDQPWPEINRLEEITRKIIDLLLDIIYGYGVLPERPLGWSILFILLFAIFFWKGKGIVPKRDINPGIKVKDISAFDALAFSFMAFLSGAKLVFDPPSYMVLPGSSKNRIRVSEGMFILERLLGMILFIAFIIAIGKTIMR